MSEDQAIEPTEPTEPDSNIEGQIDDQIDDQIQNPVPAESTGVKGHISKADWEAGGNDPADWRSPEIFEERGKWLGRVKELEAQVSRGKQETDSQVRNLNQLHGIQLQQTIADLEARRNDAIEDADTEQANLIQGQIDNTRQAKQVADAGVQMPIQPLKDPGVTAWEADNQWINNPTDPKTPYAQQQFSAYQSQGMTPAAAMVAVDADIKKAFPQINPNRNAPSSGEAPGGPGRSRSKGGPAIAMKDLTHEEARIWKSVGQESFGTEKEFLKAVANSRKEA